MRVRTGSALITILCCGSLASSASGAPLQPLKPWSLDHGSTQCTAARAYGDASAPVTLGIVPSLSGTTYMLQVSEPRPGPHFAQDSDGSVDFGKGPIKAGVLYFGAGVDQSALQFRLMASQMEQASSASTMHLQGPNRTEFELALADMPTVLDALRKCTDDLERSWNVRGSFRKPQAPLGNITDMFVTSDMPPDAMKKQRDGTQYQLMVDETGAISGCDVLVPSGSALIDTTGCQLVRERARFKPAMDTTGKAVRSVWTSPRVTWRINQQVSDNGCQTSGTSGTQISACGQSATDRMIERSGYGGGAPGRTPPQ